MTGRPSCASQDVPGSTRDLPGESYSGRACCICGRLLTHGGIPRGTVKGQSGVHVLNVEVWSCPDGPIPGR